MKNYFKISLFLHWNFKRTYFSSEHKKAVGNMSILASEDSTENKRPQIFLKIFVNTVKY